MNLFCFHTQAGFQWNHWTLIRQLFISLCSAMQVHQTVGSFHSTQTSQSKILKQQFTRNTLISDGHVFGLKVMNVWHSLGLLSSQVNGSLLLLVGSVSN